MGSSMRRSRAMASCRLSLPRLIGCLRRVSAKRRSSSSSRAVRNSISQAMPEDFSSCTSAGTVAISAGVLRASRPTAVRWYMLSRLRTVCEMKGLSSAAGMLSTQ